jgi:hypothetical protein
MPVAETVLATVDDTHGPFTGVIPIVPEVNAEENETVMVLVPFPEVIVAPFVANHEYDDNGPIPVKEYVTPVCPGQISAKPFITPTPDGGV